MNDTIAAIATARGPAGIGVIRISGPDAGRIAAKLAGRCPQPRLATLARFSDDDILDVGLLIYMPAPDSYTGEDVLEVQAHGGLVILNLLLRRILECGARQALPGEFTQRAFLSGKLDLAQAEAVADLIAAGSEEAARAAQRSLQGEFSKRCHELAEGLTRLRIRIESAIDFPEEDIDFFSDAELCTATSLQIKAASELLDAAERGRRLNDGMTVVLAGAPNVGKSSLMNRLSGIDAAIVTDIPGTTRDALREQITLHGVPLTLIDTAGLRPSNDPVEREGIRRAHLAIGQADHVLRISAPEQPAPMIKVGDARVTEICNKCDLGRRPAGWDEDARLHLSALSGDGIELLVEHLVGQRGGGEFSARRRHVDALKTALARLNTASSRLKDGQGELAAEDLRLSADAIGQITGTVTSDQLLGRIFSEFCIGK